MAITDKDVVAYEKFLGLRNTVGDESFDLGDLDAALNVDVTDAFKLRRRKGFSEVLQAGSFHSLWSNDARAFVVSGSQLYLVSPDSSIAAVRSDLTPGLRMAYTSIADRVYFSNGAQSGAYDGAGVRTWGLSVPTTQPVATAIGGSLRPGVYQFAVTFVRRDGQESGASRAGQIELSATGGILFSQVPGSDDPSVVATRLYVSPPNGDMMYLLDVLVPGATSATLMVERTGTIPLQTQFLGPPPPGTVLGYFNGRTYVANGNRLYYSEPYAPELFDLRKNYVFPSPVTLVAPMNDGLYLGTETEVGWIGGEDPAKSEFAGLLSYGAIPGTLAYVSAGDVVRGARGQVAYFATTQGICRGTDGGALENVTGERFSYPSADAGAGVVRKIGGSVQYLAILQGTEGAANVAF